MSKESTGDWQWTNRPLIEPIVIANMATTPQWWHDEDRTAVMKFANSILSSRGEDEVYRIQYSILNGRCVFKAWTKNA